MSSTFEMWQLQSSASQNRLPGVTYSRKNYIQTVLLTQTGITVHCGLLITSGIGCIDERSIHMCQTYCTTHTHSLWHSELCHCWTSFVEQPTSDSFITFRKLKMNFSLAHKMQQTTSCTLPTFD